MRLGPLIMHDGVRPERFLPALVLGWSDADGPGAPWSAAGLASTILDCTDDAPVILRAGALSVSEIQQVLGDIELRN